MQKTHKLTKSQAEVRKKQIGNLGYRLRIHIDENRDYFEGLAQIEATVFRKDMDLVLDCADTEIMSIKNAEGQEILYRHQDHQLILESKNFAVAMLGDRLDLQITYRSRFSENGLGFFRFCDQADGRYYCYTDLEPFEAHRVFPCFDQPDLKIRFSLEVSAPAKWEVFANEPVLSTMLEGERRVWSFMETPPISTYVFSLVAGEYKVVEFGEFKVPMRVAGRHSQFHKIPVERMAEVAQLSLDYFEKLLDCEYPFRKHDQIFVPEYTSGAMENCGLVTFSEYWLSDSEMTHRQKMALDNTIAHEMAHMWFGNLVTMTWWGDLWLNESFATQLAYRCLAETGLYPEAMLAFTYEVKQMAMQADELSSTHPIVAECVDTEEAFANFDRITYEKGACVLQQLIALMGMPKFFKGIRAYLKKFAYSNATYQEFLACFGEEFVGELGTFCEDWFLSSGVNNLTVSSDKNGAYHIKQESGSGSQRLRTHRLLGLALKIKEGQLIEVSKKPVVVRDQQVEVFRFEKDSMPDLVFLNHEDWAYARVFLDPLSLGKIAQVLPLIDKPFLRQQLWLTMGDMVERERMSPLTYLNLAIQLVEQEKDSLIVLSILDDLQPFFSSYLPEPVKQSVRCQIFDMTYRMLTRETDYGVLIRWYTTAVAAACTPKHLDILAEWLQLRQVGNLSLSQDYIYNGLYKLAYGRHKNTENLLRTMESEDGRETGIKCARVIRLILQKDKRADFFRILSQSGGSQDMLSWEMRAFFHPMQKAEQQELVLSYFNALPEIFASRDKIFCRSLMDSMFPLAYIEESLIQSVALLQKPNLNPGLRRGLSDRVDLMSRYKRICAKVMQENYEKQC